MNKLLTTMFAVSVACVTISAAAQDSKGDAKVGAKTIAMCIGCHGIVGYQASFPQVHKVPMIAGQSATYIASALTAYKEGARKHPTMRAIADTLSEKDILNLAAYYSQLGVTPGDAPPAAPAKAPSERVQALIARNQGNACTNCHGANFNTPNDGTVPKLAGQHADYLYVSLLAYRDNSHATVGRANAVMRQQVEGKKYSSAELKDMAGYIASLPGEVKTVPESRFHRAGD